jgi:membrane protease YdiL (CAAX protease family)
MNEAKEPRSPRLAILLALTTLAVMGGSGVGIIAGIQERPLSQVVLGAGCLWLQALVGLAAGCLIAFMAWRMIVMQRMRPVLDRYAAIVGPLMPGRPLQLMVSVSAGVGEELFFRGALQHWLGVPVTAVVFVALHGYLDPRDWRVLAYGLFMTGVMLLFGFYAEANGLVAPIVAHAVIDIVLIDRLARHWRTLPK